MSFDDYFWKAFEATGSPEMYLMYKNKTKAKGSDRDKRNANL